MLASSPSSTILLTTTQNHTHLPHTTPRPTHEHFPAPFPVIPTSGSFYACSQGPGVFT